MNIRWRLSVLVLQLLLLGSATYYVTGGVLSTESWFWAGLLAVTINPQLLEPYYPKRGDVIANSLVGLLLIAISKKTVATLGWYFLSLCLGLALILGFLALFGTPRREAQGRLVRVARSARLLSQKATARTIFSAVFWLALIESLPYHGDTFWVLAITWSLLILLGLVNWQAVWSGLAGAPAPCRAEGMVGPSQLLASGIDFGEAGSRVLLEARSVSAEGTVITRIRRPSDVWAQVLVQSREDCERLLSAGAFIVRPLRDGDGATGYVDVGSSDLGLRFVATRLLEVGQVVRIAEPSGEREVLFQLTRATIETASVKGGAQLVVRAEAAQLGYFDRDALKLRRHRWVPTLGAAVVDGPAIGEGEVAEAPPSWILLGHVIGTNLPVYLDWAAACEGHVAILGMTKMGKTTLAVRLARVLGTSRRVAVLDQTGEYVSKRGFPRYEAGTDWKVPGVSVFEPRPDKEPPAEALSFLKRVVEVASGEYESGVPTPRILLLDEAHQFVPEPSGLGFGMPGRDQAYKFGVLMMQVRKYGISIVLVSQRTAVVAKSALSQCENIIAFRSVDQTGLDYLEAIGGSEVRKLLPRLNQGEALAFGPAISSENPVGIAVTQESDS